MYTLLYIYCIYHNVHLKLPQCYVSIIISMKLGGKKALSDIFFPKRFLLGFRRHPALHMHRWSFQWPWQDFLLSFHGTFTINLIFCDSSFSTHIYVSGGVQLTQWPYVSTDVIESDFQMMFTPDGGEACSFLRPFHRICVCICSFIFFQII